MDYGDLSHTRLITELVRKHSFEFEFKDGTAYVNWNAVYFDFMKATGLDEISCAEIVTQYMDESIYTYE